MKVIAHFVICISALVYPLFHEKNISCGKRQEKVHDTLHVDSVLDNNTVFMLHSFTPVVRCLFMEILQFPVEIYSCVKTYFDEFHHLLSS